MKYKKYPAYYDSGVDWLGIIPTDWNTILGRRLFANKKDARLENDVQLAASQTYGVIPQNELMARTEQKLALAITGISSFKHVDADDFVISLRSFEGGFERAKYPGCITPAYTVLSSITPIVPGYWEYFFKSSLFISKIQTLSESLRDGKSINYEAFGRLVLPIPPFQIQNSIAKYLDRETASIDDLVLEHESLIVLLKEKRSALITKAVTKGLNSNLKMKDSGVEWLGEIPEGWEVIRLRFKVKINPKPKQDLSDTTEVTFLPMVAIGEDGSINLDQTKLVGEVNNGYTYFCDGDVVYARITPCFENGKGAVMQGLTNGMGYGTTELAVLRPISIEAKYLWYITISYPFRKNGEAYMYGASGQKRVPDDFTRDFKIGLPSNEEQVRIIDRLDEETRRLDMLINESIDVITLLKERRSALITAAVTGKIDVRDEVPS